MLLLLGRFAIAVIAFLFFVFILPLVVHAGVWLAQDRPANWMVADWSASGLLPSPSAQREPSIRVLAARTGGLKGAVSVHSWIVLKRANASAYERYDVVGWGAPVRRNAFPADGRWYSNDPEVIVEIVGACAEALLPKVDAAIRDYRWSRQGDYRIWPGPNSNTFVAAVLSAVPEMGARLPPTAVGRDFPANGEWFGRAPEGGVTLSLGGFVGVTLGIKEGIEMHLLGLTAGLQFARPALILPGFGRIPLWA